MERNGVQRDGETDWGRTGERQGGEEGQQGLESDGADEIDFGPEEAGWGRGGSGTDLEIGIIF